MRKNIVAGNWKMNNNIQESVALVKSIKELLKSEGSLHTDIIVAPSYVNLYEVHKEIKDSAIKLAAQNCSSETSGAFTGEISVSMLQSAGCEYVIIGHSERRSYFDEDDAILSRKVEMALQTNLQVIFCIGERLMERERGDHFNVIKKQLKNTIFQLDASAFSRIIIAYEPVWAIGTGVTASSGQAQEMHSYIRTLMADHFDSELAGNTSLLYGGSCNSKNARELFSNPDVDGGLIGGASLKAEDFVAIVKSF